jgi:SAM-dependent methyltransferase
MINYLLKYPNIYRFYQKLIRKQHDEYNFINFIIKETAATKDIRMLDLCSGDSYILERSHKYIKNYLGIDNNPFYLKKCKKKWKQFNFINLDLNNLNNIKIYKKFDPNFIFMMGALHHFDDYTVSKITACVKSFFPKSIFLSVDPVRYNNSFINNFMINLDRGKFIRNINQYNKLIKDFDFYITDDFYKMSFKYIFHYRNLNLEKCYKKWKKNIIHNS